MKISNAFENWFKQICNWLIHLPFKKKKQVILICIVTTVTSAPTSQYTINIDGPEGRHVQMGEPGKAVSGYYT